MRRIHSGATPGILRLLAVILPFPEAKQGVEEIRALLPKLLRFIAHPSKVAVLFCTGRRKESGPKTFTIPREMANGTLQGLELFQDVRESVLNALLALAHTSTTWIDENLLNLTSHIFLR